jgi:putative ABC transport system ATP-binding protein
MAAALEAYDLYRFYHAGEDETLALRGVSLSIERGETVAILGPSGSGKSTLIACVAGLDEPDGGFVRIDSERMTRRPESIRAEIRARRMGILLQSSNLFDHLSVEDNIRLQMRLAGKSDEGRVREVLDMVGLGHRRSARPAQLSGGEASRAGLAVALAPHPALLLADEPTGEVDEQTELRILAIFDEHRKRGGASMIVTHSDAVSARADRIIHLVDGRIAD